uniref:Uncharacterized protein n=1 Tax=Nelumbo nucifera TaxID=4432 RepID=A0A822ZA56_NELNU|nr:TPA_asm: hypothetical protein HUJ06_014239 [Nelumbo nucifera]
MLSSLSSANMLIPDDMEFQSRDMLNYTTSDESVKIQKDSEVRLKRVDATEIRMMLGVLMAFLFDGPNFCRATIYVHHAIIVCHFVPF